MIYEEINERIANAMKEHNEDALRTYRLIKTEMLKAEKDGVKLDETNQNKILLKMVAQREDAIKQFTDGGRPELAEGEKKELEILKEIAPKQASDDEIRDYTREVANALKMAQNSLSMKDMKPIMIDVQKKYPTANGKIISEVIKSMI